MTMTARIYWDEKKKGVWIETPFNEAFKEELKARCRWQRGQGRRWDPSRKAWWVKKSYLDVALSIVLKHFGKVRDETAGTRNAYEEANERFRREREERRRAEEENRRQREQDAWWKSQHAEQERKQERHAYEEEARRDRFYEEIFNRRNRMSRAEALAILGLTIQATLTEMKRAYRTKVLQFHPDRGGDVEQMKKVNVAWETLKSLN